MTMLCCFHWRHYWRDYLWCYRYIIAGTHHLRLWLLNCYWVLEGWWMNLLGVSLDSHSYQLRKNPKSHLSHRNIINNSIWVVCLCPYLSAFLESVTHNRRKKICQKSYPLSCYFIKRCLNPLRRLILRDSPKSLDPVHWWLGYPQNWWNPLGLHVCSTSTPAVKNRKMSWWHSSVDRNQAFFRCLASDHLCEAWCNFTEACTLARSLMFGLPLGKTQTGRLTLLSLGACIAETNHCCW